MNRITRLWQKVWQRDKETCQLCGKLHTIGNTHTVTTIYLEKPIQWQEATEDTLLCACFDCIMIARMLFKLRADYEEKHGKKA